MQHPATDVRAPPGQPVEQQGLEQRIERRTAPTPTRLFYPRHRCEVKREWSQLPWTRPIEALGN